MTAVKKLLGRVGLGAVDRGAAVTLTAPVLGSLTLPVLVVSAAGEVVAANETAQGLCDAVRGGHVPGLSASAARALSSGRSQVEVVMVPGPLGSLLYELSVLPTAEGNALVIAKDVTLESNLRATLVESRQRYKDLVEISTDFAWELGPDGSFAFVSPRGALGYSADELVGHLPAEFVIDQPGVNALQPFVSEKPIEDVEVWMRRSNGRPACLQVSSSPLLDADGSRRGARGICRDITKERERDAALARANNRERLLAYIVRTMRDVVDPSDILRIAAEAISRALGGDGCQIFRHGKEGFTPAAAFGEVGDPSPVLAALVTEDSFEVVTGGRLANGQVTRHRTDVNGALIVWADGEALRWSGDEHILLGDVANQIGIANEQIANHERILTLSRTDGLTGLFNRRAFFEELSRRFARLARERKPAALIYVDLDNFKLVNDVHGHKRGDDALLAVREILVRHTRPIDLLARLGGDEFALWLEGADEQTAIRRCEAMIEASAALHEYSGSPDLPLTMSLGVAVHDPGHPETLSDVLARADDAMYAVKREGKSDFRLARPARQTQTGRLPP